ncbi:collagen-binding domain-containing protein [Micromonospora sp. DT231]|uniref:collagen-binding domain-containing protein n=1 Tax=Micromonospora sp. DT231 TaxID=3416526 RepID=UPI003CF0C8EA
MRARTSVGVRRLLLPLVGGSTAVVLALLATTSEAQPRLAVDPVAGTQGFLVMTAGDARLIGAENEGTIAVGGNLSFGNYQVAGSSAGSFVVPPDSNPTALLVGGQVDFAASVPGSRLQVLQNGYVKIGDLTGTFVRDTDNNSAAVNTRVLPANDYEASPRVELVTRQPVASVGPSSPLDFGGAFEGFRATATSLATCQQNVVLTTPEGAPLPRPVPPGSNAVVTLAPGVTNVLNLSASDLANISVLTFADQPTPDTPLLVNVDTSGVGDAFVWRVPNFAGIGGDQARYILFNLPTATSITLTEDSASLEGTIYAPNAALNAATNGNIEGSVISRTLTHDGGEIHDFPFSTLLNCSQPTPTPTASTPTPTPSTPTPTPTTPTPTPTTPTPTPTTPTPTPTGPTPTPTGPTPTPTGPTSVPTTQPPVSPTGYPTKHPLPVTGTSSGPMLGIGAAGVGLGVALLLLARLRLRRNEN